MAAHKVLLVSFSNDRFMNLLVVGCCYPFVIDDKHCFAPWVWSLEGDLIIRSGMLCEFISVDLGSLFACEVIIFCGVIRVSPHPCKC